MKIFYIAALLSLSGGAFAGVSPELSVRTASSSFLVSNHSLIPVNGCEVHFPCSVDLLSPVPHQTISVL